MAFRAILGDFVQKHSTSAAARAILRVQSHAPQNAIPNISYSTENRPVTATRAAFCFFMGTPGRFSAFAGRFVTKIVQNAEIVVHWVQQKAPGLEGA